ncbi:hypothetical protein LSH36_443g03022 [Paralvinella palmiformis]|uniref:Uncharacterized protein n=1 Tax=Paralvinella palmiformis TaxID=53620 RepID=A0AAD9JB86_9ANNE|nr:hypothetical protein LSH36_443g03022 [Paralvinella palmiformis]
MLHLTNYVLFCFCIFGVGAIDLFWKRYHKKMAVDATVSYPVKGPLDCEKLCIEMGDSCQAVNVIYTKSNYACDVIARFTYNKDEIGNLMRNNPNGKLVIKQGKW